MKRTLILAAVAAVLTIASVGYFAFVRPNRNALPVVSAEGETEAKTTPAGTIAAPGIVEAVSEETEVGAEIAGKLKEVAVEEGDEVARGQIVAVLENEDFATAVKTARAAVETLRSARESARARLAQSEAERRRIANGARTEERAEARSAFEQTLPGVENARREYERRQKLFASGDVSREDLERARTAFETALKQSRTTEARFAVVDAPARADDLARADAAVRLGETQLGELDAQINEAAARVREAEARLEKTLIRAPLAGVVLRKRLKAGETVSPEAPTGIVTIADTSTLRVRADVDETDVARIRTGQTAYVTADAYGSQRFAARVVRVGQILGRKNFRTERPTEKVDTKILEVLLELAPDQRLPLGLRVDAFITAE